MQEKNSHANCLVLSDSAENLSAALRDALAERDCRIEIITNAHRAFARLCLIERLETVRSGWGLERSAPLTLVIAADPPQTILSALLEARDHYLPTAGVLQWRDDDMLELRPAVLRQAPPTAHGQDSVTHGRSAPSAHARNDHSYGPNLHLVEPPDDEQRIRPHTGASKPSGADNGEETSHSSAASLSADEYRMLLGNQQDGSNS